MVVWVAVEWAAAAECNPTLSQLHVASIVIPAIDVFNRKQGICFFAGCPRPRVRRAFLNSSPRIFLVFNLLVISLSTFLHQIAFSLSYFHHQPINPERLLLLAGRPAEHHPGQRLYPRKKRLLLFTTHYNSKYSPCNRPSHASNHRRSFALRVNGSIPCHASCGVRPCKCWCGRTLL